MLFAHAGWMEVQDLLILADFDAAVLEVEIAVLLQADSTIIENPWGRVRFTTAGALLDGGVGWGRTPALAVQPCSSPFS